MLQHKWNSNHKLAAGLAGLMLVWVLSGFLRGIDQETETNPESETLFQIKARSSLAQSYQPIIKVSGRTEAERVVSVRAEVDGVVEGIPIEEGAFVQAGDSLCKLAVEDRQQQLTQAEAAVGKAQLDYDGAKKLKSGGYQSESAIASAKASLAAAQADLARARLDLANLNIRAPFAGIVEAREAEVGDLIQRGSPCASLIDLDPLVVAGQVAEADIGQLSVGQDVQVTLVSGATVKGNIGFVGRRSDPVTRTFRIEVKVPNPDMSLLAGVTADLKVESKSVNAHLISPSLLSLDDRGRVAIRIVDDSDKVRLIAVKLIGDDTAGVWVTGLPEQVRVITVGQEYVFEGQEVAVVMDELSQEASISRL